MRVMTADPLRHRILAAVAEGVRTLSIREISDRIGEPQRRVRHAVDALLQAGLVGIDRTEVHRGTFVRFFRARMKPVIWTGDAELSEDELGDFGKQILRFVVADAVDAVKEGTFAEGDSQLFARTRRLLDRQGCEELKEIYERALQEADAATWASSERVASEGVEGIEMVSAMLIFKAPRSQ